MSVICLGSFNTEVKSECRSNEISIHRFSFDSILLFDAIDSGDEITSHEHDYFCGKIQNRRTTHDKYMYYRYIYFTSYLVSGGSATNGISVRMTLFYTKTNGFGPLHGEWGPNGHHCNRLRLSTDIGATKTRSPGLWPLAC